MKIKTSELTGPALDWAVAKCEGVELMSFKFSGDTLKYDVNGQACWEYWNPSTDWSQGGPIIEREGICISPSAAGLASWVADTPLRPTSFADKTRCSGTPLIAAMRCYVASKMGDEVDIPEELNYPIAATSRVIVKATANIGKSLK